MLKNRTHDLDEIELKDKAVDDLQLCAAVGLTSKSFLRWNKSKFEKDETKKKKIRITLYKKTFKSIVMIFDKNRFQLKIATAVSIADKRIFSI